MRLALFVVVGLVLVFALYVRLAPSDPAAWHVDLDVSGNETERGAAKRVVPSAADQLAALHEIAVDTPRTRVLAGEVALGHVTYVTRSALWGFPDYTTVQVRDGDLALWGRLRFGSSDLGVNAARLDAWLAQLNAG